MQMRRTGLERVPRRRRPAGLRGVGRGRRVRAGAGGRVRGAAARAARGGRADRRARHDRRAHAAGSALALAGIGATFAAQVAMGDELADRCRPRRAHRARHRRPVRARAQPDLRRACCPRVARAGADGRRAGWRFVGLVGLVLALELQVRRGRGALPARPCTATAYRGLRRARRSLRAGLGRLSSH